MKRRERRGVELAGRRAGGVTVSRQDEIVLQFDYGQIAEERRAFVQEMAAGVKGRLGNMARGALEVGAMLNAIRGDFPHGAWQPFLMQEYGFTSPRQPQRWMQAAARLGHRLEEFVGLPDTVLGLLAGATDAVIEQVAERVATGRAVGVADVRLLMGDSGCGERRERKNGLGVETRGERLEQRGEESAGELDAAGVGTDDAWEEVGEGEQRAGGAAADVAAMGPLHAMGGEVVVNEVVGSQQLVMFAEEPESDWEALGWLIVQNEAGWHAIHLVQGVATDTCGTRSGVVHKLQVGAFSAAFLAAQRGGGVAGLRSGEVAVCIATERRYAVMLPEWVVVKLRVAAEMGRLDEVLTRPGVQVLLGALGEVEE